MARGRNWMVALVAILALGTPDQAFAQVAPLNPWTTLSTSNPASATINTTPVNITVSAGTNRILLVAAVLETATAGTVSSFNVTLGGEALTPLATTEATSARETVKVWYLRESQIPVGAEPLIVTGAHTQVVDGLHVYWASYSSVDQTNPVFDSGATYSAATSVTFGSVIDYLANGRTFYVSGNGGTVTHTPPATFTQAAAYTNSNNQSSAAAGTAVHAAAGNYAAGTTVNWAGGSARSAVVVASLRPATLGLSLTPDGGSIFVAEDITYTITVTNGSSATRTNVTVTDTLPVGLTFVSATPSQGTCVNTPPVTCSLATLAAGDTASVTVVANAPTAGSYVNSASVTATETDQDASNNSANATTVVTVQTRNADLSLAMTGPATLALGTIGVNATYTLTVTNGGPLSATGVIVSDALPAGMTYISATPSQGSCTGTAIVTCALGAMANGGTATVTIVAMNTSMGTKANTATVSNPVGAEYDPNLINNNATVTTTLTGGAAPLCVVPGKDGAAGTISGVVNTYYPGTASVAAGAASTCIAVGTPRGSATAISNGDMLLVIQMQDATIDATNTANYGGGTGTGAGATAVNAGKYEFVRANGAVGAGGCAAGSVSISGAGTNNGLLNAYTNSNATTTKGQARFQVVRVPQYTSATLNGVTAAPWVTNTVAPIGLGTGGVLAIDVAGTMTVNAGVAASVDGQGFRGGAGRQLTGGGPATNTDYRNPSTVPTHGGKGEGGAGTPRWVFDPNGSHTCGAAIGASPSYFIDTLQPNDGYPNGSMARGAPANAGGGSTDGNSGGNDQNSGGGGGSNGGAGGRGGLSWNTGLNNGGLGAAVTPALTKLVLGGGGGAGTRNNGDCGTNGATAAQEGQSSSGASGGGLIVLRAGSLVAASGAILSANGNSAFDDTLNDGGGGGGAGGSVIVAVTSGDLSNLNIRARGGQGGSAWKLSAPGTPGEFTVGAANLRHGPGGGGGGGVIVYTNTAVAPTLDAAGGAAGTTTTANSNFGALPGDNGQTLLAAPGLIPGAGSASDCTSDLSVNLEHQETTVTPGGTATLRATVTNNAPFVATSGLVTVVVTLDSWMAPTLASGTGWTCGVAGQVVTCTRSTALAAKLSYPPISITANVLAGAPSYLSNTASVTNAGDYNAGNNTIGDTVGVRGPTLAVVREFKAVRVGGKVHLRWSTSFESNNLGFRIYRESGAVRELVTPSLIAGSALSTGSRRASDRRYSWIDASPRADSVYWLEDVDLNGTRTMSARAIPTQARDGDFVRGAGDDALSPLLSTLGRKRFDRDWIRRVFDKPADRRAASAGVKLLVRQEGWYRITRDELRAAGWDPGSSPATLQLFTGGVEQAMLVRDGGDGLLHGTDTIEFYGTGTSSQYDDARVYWLIPGGRGLRIKTGLASGTVAAPASFSFTVERKDRTLDFLGLTNNGDNDNFFGDVVSSDPITNALLVTNIDRDASQEPTLTVALQGATAGTLHQVDVTVNGISAGSLNFTGQEHSVKSFNLPHAWLREGSNDIGFIARGAGEDISVIDFIRITYARRYAFDGAPLRLTAPGGTHVTLRGLPDRSLRVIDITTPGQPVTLTPMFAGGAGQTTATIGVSGGGTATLYAFTAPRTIPAEDVIPDQPSSLDTPSNGADLVVIAHSSMLAAVEPLVALRRSQGLSVAVVDVTDVYDEFASGQRTPYAIRDFLRQAVRTWRRAPRFALLVGDATFDPKNYLGFGQQDLVPTKMVATTYLKTMSDDWFVDFNEDGIPDLAIGRLPARTADDTSLMVSKILAREDAIRSGVEPGAWGSRMLLVSDENFEFNFETATSALRPLVPASISVQELAAERVGESTSAEIASRINEGQLLVNYAGHGSVERWSHLGLFGDNAAAALTNGERLPVFVLMTCLNGFFADLYSESLAEGLMLSPQGGAVAVWASSGLTEPTVQAAMNQELFRQLFTSSSITLGEAVIGAKSSVGDLDVRRTWILFGDPTMRVR
jgi:uncharacterized repeat protein (TIGR01451 family)